MFVNTFLKSEPGENVLGFLNTNWIDKVKKIDFSFVQVKSNFSNFGDLL